MGAQQASRYCGLLRANNLAVKVVHTVIPNCGQVAGDVFMHAMTAAQQNTRRQGMKGC